MVFYLIRILILLSLFFSKELYSEKIEKIIFSVQDKIYTTIDLDQRIKYIELLTKNRINLSESEYLEDFVSVILFNEFAKRNHLTIDEEKMNEYLTNMINQYKQIDPEKYEKLDKISPSKKEEFLFQIKYDYQRKTILQKLLNNKNLINLKLNEDEILNLFDVELIYFSFNLNPNANIQEIKNIIDFNDINKTIKNLKKLNINYNLYSKKIKNFETINKSIRNEILKNNTYFVIDEDDIYLIGKIKKTIKNNIDIKYTFFQITSDVNIDNNLIKCENINYLKNLNNIKIKKFDKIEIQKLNNTIKNNLTSINDFILFNENNTNSFVILCDFVYDKNIIEQILINEIINQEVKDIEYEFILQKKIDYNFRLHE